MNCLVRERLENIRFNLDLKLSNIIQKKDSVTYIHLSTDLV